MISAVIQCDLVCLVVTERDGGQFWCHILEKTPPVGEDKQSFKKFVKGFIGCCYRPFLGL